MQTKTAKAEKLVTDLTVKIDSSAVKEYLPGPNLLNEVDQVLNFLESDPFILAEFMSGGEKNWMMKDLYFAVIDYKKRLINGV